MKGLQRHFLSLQFFSFSPADPQPTTFLRLLLQPLWLLALPQAPGPHASPLSLVCLGCESFDRLDHRFQLVLGKGHPLPFRAVSSFSRFEKRPHAVSPS